MKNGNGHYENYAFGDFRVDAESLTLWRGKRGIHLAKRPFSVLLFLIENRERVVSRDELLEKYWEGHDVYDDALRKCVGAIRKALSDTDKLPKYVETRWGSGYRFIGALRETNEARIKQIVKPDNDSETAEEKHESIQPPVEDEPTAVNEKPTIYIGFKNRYVLTGILAATLISLTALTFLSYRPALKNAEAKSLIETIASGKRSIVILPLKNLTGSAANDYLSDGVTESLINELSRVESLRVISRSSAFQFKDKNVSAQEIGEKLGVETILEGSLKQSGEQLRVEVRLVNAKDGLVIWAGDSEQKKLTDIFAIQDQITCQIVTELKVKICGEVAPAERYTKNVKAFQLYLEGQYYRNRLGPEDFKKAISFFNQALQIDPNYPLAHEGLASTYAVMELNAIVPPGMTAPLAAEHAQKALDADDSLAGAYIALGAVKTMNDYDLAEREKYYRLALMKNPNHRTAHLWLANNYTVQGKFEEAEGEILRAQEIDPLSFGVHLTLAELYWYWRKPDKVIEQAELMLDLSLDQSCAYTLLARAYADQGDFERAFAALDKIPSDDLMRLYVLSAAGGHADEMSKSVNRLVNSELIKTSPFKVACAYALFGDKTSALAWLEKSYAARQGDLVSLKIDPAFKFIHDDPEYQELIRKVHLAE